jgi:hypothetical protein
MRQTCDDTFPVFQMLLARVCTLCAGW